MKNSASIDANKIGFIDAYFKNEFYRRANWVNCVLVIISAVSQLSSSLFVNGNIRDLIKNDEPQLLGIGTFSALIVFLASTLSILTVSCLGRKTILLFGLGTLSALHLTAGVLHLFNNDQKKLLYLIVFALVYAATIGPATWLYSTET